VRFFLGVFVCIGLIALGYQLSMGIIHIKSLDRTVTVKGLSEREVPANIAIWPITFHQAGNDLNQLFSDIQQKNALIANFLKSNGFRKSLLLLQGYWTNRPKDIAALKKLSSDIRGIQPLQFILRMWMLLERP
jgi:hypothetical protein